MGDIIKRDQIILIALFLILSTLSSPGYNLFYLTFFQFIPLFYLLSKYPEKWLKLSSIAGFSYYSIYYYWLIYPAQFTGFPIYTLGLMNVILIALYHTAYFIIFCFFFIKFPYLTPLIYFLCEVIKAHILTGFPWGELSYNLYNHPVLTNISSIITTEGLSGIIIFFNLMIYYLIFSHKSKKRIFTLITTTFIIFISLNYMILIHKKGKNSPIKNVKIAVIQGNIPEEVKIKDKNAIFVLTKYINLTEKVIGKEKIDLIVWPEAIYTRPFENDTSDLKKIFLNFLKKYKISLIFGSPYIYFDIENNRYIAYNSMYFIKNGDIEHFERYDKIHLVPFGEYTPLKKLLFFVNKFVPGIDYSSGKKLRIFKFKSLHIIPLICYEGIFSNLIKKGKNLGGNIVINISNEAWFDNSKALWQHLAADVLRATESSIYFIKCANNGISAIITPYGKILKLIPPDKADFITN